MAAEPGCVFCAILAGSLPASFIYRDGRTAAFMDIQPVTPGHVLVIPAAHAPSLADLEREDGERLFAVGQRVAAAARTAAESGAIRCEGVNFFLADGVAAGQEVFHVHLHVLPRFAGDGFGLTFPADYAARPPRAELDRIAAALQRALPASATGHASL
jgi:diadenosine tetraphosphate (Ap4A) HIT family hydrolase